MEWIGWWIFLGIMTIPNILVWIVVIHAVFNDERQFHQVPFGDHGHPGIAGPEFWSDGEGGC